MHISVPWQSQRITAKDHWMWLITSAKELQANGYTENLKRIIALLLCKFQITQKIIFVNSFVNETNHIKWPHHLGPDRQVEKQANICPKSGSKIQSQRNQTRFSLSFLPDRKCHNRGKTNRKEGLTFSSPPKICENTWHSHYMSETKFV